MGKSLAPTCYYHVNLSWIDESINFSNVIMSAFQTLVCVCFLVSLIVHAFSCVLNHFAVVSHATSTVSRWKRPTWQSNSGSCARAGGTAKKTTPRAKLESATRLAQATRTPCAVSKNMSKCRAPALSGTWLVELYHLFFTTNYLDSSIHPSIHQSIHPSIHPSIHTFTHPPKQTDIQTYRQAH